MKCEKHITLEILTIGHGRSSVYEVTVTFLVFVASLDGYFGVSRSLSVDYPI